MILKPKMKTFPFSSGFKEDLEPVLSLEPSPKLVQSASPRTKSKTESTHGTPKATIFLLTLPSMSDFLSREIDTEKNKSILLI